MVGGVSTVSQSGSLPSGLVAFYKCNENAANSTVADDSGNSHDAVANANYSPVNTSTFYDASGKVSSCFDLNGSNELIICGSASDWSFTNKISVFLWINPDSVSGEKALVTKWTAAGDKREWAFVIQDGKLEVWFGDPADGTDEGAFSTTSTAVDTSGWQWVGFTYDGSVGTEGDLEVQGTIYSDKLYVGTTAFSEATGTAPILQVDGGGIANRVIEDIDSDTDDVLSTGITSGYGMLIVTCTTDSISGIFRLEHQTIASMDANVLFSITKDNASTYNVYWDTDQYKVQNKVGDNKNISVAYFGT